MRYKKFATLTFATVMASAIFTGMVGCIPTDNDASDQDDNSAATVEVALLSDDIVTAPQESIDKIPSNDAPEYRWLPIRNLLRGGESNDRTSLFHAQ